MIKICLSVTSHALDTPSLLSQTVTPSRTPSPLERDVLYGRPHISICNSPNIGSTKYTYDTQQLQMKTQSLVASKRKYNINLTNHTIIVLFGSSKSGCLF